MLRRMRGVNTSDTDLRAAVSSARPVLLVGTTACAHQDGAVLSQTAASGQSWVPVCREAHL